MSTLFPTTVPSKRLSESITGASTSFKLNNIEGWDGNDLTSSDFGTILYAVFRNSANTLMEIMQIDPTTITSASSPITITLRGLKFTGDISTEVSGNKLTWIKGDTIVELGTHVPQLLKHYLDTVNDQSADGTKTFSAFPVKSGTTTPSSSSQFATKGYVDSVVGGSANYDQNIISGIAGETLAAGNLVYFKTADGRWWLTDADTSSTVDGVILGFAQASASAAASVNIVIGGIDKNQSGLTAGVTYYASNTAGALSSSAGTTERIVGKALTTTTFILDQEFAVLPTALQKTGLSSTVAPSSTNKYLTQKDFQKGSEIYAADSAGNDTYVVTLSPAPAAYVNGMTVRFKAGTANTGAATLNVNGLGAIAIVKHGSSVLIDNDILSGQVCEVVYDGTNFQLLNPESNVIVTTKIATFTTNVAVSSSTAETTLFTATVPGGSLSTANVVRGKLYFTGLQVPNTKTVTFRFKYGATTLVTTVGTNGTGGTFGSVGGHLDFVLYASGATNSQEGTLEVVGISGVITNGYSGIFDVSVGTSAIDSTADQTILVSVQFNDTSGAVTAVNGYIALTK